MATIQVINGRPHHVDGDLPDGTYHIGPKDRKAPKTETKSSKAKTDKGKDDGK